MRAVFAGIVANDRRTVAESEVRRYAVKDVPIVGKQLSFAAVLENWAEGLDYCAVAVPAAITEALGTHAAVAVLARLNDSEPFKVSLFPVGGGRHYIRIRAKIRKETGTKTGDRVTLRFTVLDRAAVTYPRGFARGLTRGRSHARLQIASAGAPEFHHPAHRRGRQTRNATQTDR